MATKLTLTLSQEVIDQAKLYASNKGRSLSEMVESFFKYLTDSELEEKPEQMSERVSKLRGILKVDDNFDYKAVLNEERSKKHGV